MYSFGRILFIKALTKSVINVQCEDFLCIFQFYGFPVQVGRYLPEVDKMFDFSKEKVVAGFEESLQRLGLDYVDVLQVSELLFVFRTRM